MNVYTRVLFVAAFIVSFSVQAEGDVAINSKRIVGAWSAKQADIVNHITYSGDGTFQGHMLKATTGATFWNYEGRWTLKGNWLRYIYTKSDSKRVEVGYRNQDNVLELDDKHFIVRTSTGEERIYSRE